MLSAEQAEQLSALGAAIHAALNKPSKPQMQSIAALYSELCVALATAPAKRARKGPDPATPQFDLSFRSTGHWQTINSWEAIAKFLGLAKSTVHVQFSHGGGRVTRNWENPAMDGNDDVLVVTHVNRRFRSK